ncbi:MAG TPA: hypothetical protein VGK29_22720 [Paludibaculum sp.]
MRLSITINAKTERVATQFGESVFKEVNKGNIVHCIYAEYYRRANYKGDKPVYQPTESIGAIAAATAVSQASKEED